MNHSETKHETQNKAASAATERKRGQGKTASALVSVQPPREPSVLHADTEAKFCLFNIALSERRAGGPIMRGFLEITNPEGGEPIKVNVGAWAKVGAESGTEYLSLKVGNRAPKEEQAGDGSADLYTVGPFYGRLFRQVEKRESGDKVRYFGFIEDSEKVREDASGRGVYETHWQLRVSAKRAVSNDGQTRYLVGTTGRAVAPRSADNAEDVAF